MYKTEIRSIDTTLFNERKFNYIICFCNNYYKQIEDEEGVCLRSFLLPVIDYYVGDLMRCSSKLLIFFIQNTLQYVSETFLGNTKWLSKFHKILFSVSYKNCCIIPLKSALAVFAQKELPLKTLQSQMTRNDWSKFCKPRGNLLHCFL